MEAHTLYRLLTPQLPGTGGRIKTEPKDFIVEELPLYRPEGRGEHLYLWVEKRGVPMERMLKHIARTLDIPRREIGYAGLKDKVAITRQYVSVPYRDYGDGISQLSNAFMTVLDSDLHVNKLKPGHHWGNAFTIVIRDVDDDALERAEEVVSILQRQGIPNFFGPQRFGADMSTVDMGLELLRDHQNPAVKHIARDRFKKKFHLSAVQSVLFNHYLVHRMEVGMLRYVLRGDILKKTDTGGLFVSRDIETDRLRLELGEVVPTGPIFGLKMKQPEDDARRMEEEVLRATSVPVDNFSRFPKLMQGTRRPLIVYPRDCRVSSHPEGLELSFALPKGAYATVLLDEVMKTGDQASLEDPDDMTGEG